MAIRTSSARDVDALLQQLRSPVTIERDAAIARLRIIGARARDRVLALTADAAAGREVRVAALKIAEAYDDPAARRAAIAAADDADAVVAAAAIHVLRPWLTRDEDTSALEHVTALVADEARPADLRRAALEALSDLPASLTHALVQSVAAQLAPDPPLDDPATASEWLTNHEDVPLGVLHDLLCHARDRQRDAPDDAHRNAWLGLRVRAHALLARRDSRIALYDAREMFEKTAGPLPLDLLVIIKAIGDVSCLEALARAWETVSHDAWWREQVRDAANVIVRREKATGRNAVVKRVRTRWPGFLGAEGRR